MLIKQRKKKRTLVLFTSAVRREGGFFKASLKEVSMAPVIFITSAHFHRRPHFPRLLVGSSAGLTHIPAGLVLAEPSMDGVYSPKKRRRKGDRPGELRLLQEREANFTSTHCAAEKQRRLVKSDRKVVWDMPC